MSKFINVVILQTENKGRIRLVGPGREILILKIKGSNPLCATKETLKRLVIIGEKENCQSGRLGLTRNQVNGLLFHRFESYIFRKIF